jgi:hypothetical protein
MPQPGSALAASVNAPMAASNQNEWRRATARSNGGWAAAAQSTGK